MHYPSGRLQVVAARVANLVGMYFYMLHSPPVDFFFFFFSRKSQPNRDGHNRISNTANVNAEVIFAFVLIFDKY